MSEKSSPKRLRFYAVSSIALVGFFGAIYGFKWYQDMKAAQAAAQTPPMYQSISSAKATTTGWHRHVESVATLVASKGVDITTQVAGKVTAIYFKSGDQVKKGQELISLDDRADIQQLNNYIATMKLAKLTEKRNRYMYKAGSVSKGDYDAAKAAYDVAAANVEMQQAVIDYKHIRAPFSGKMGIRQVNLGQYLANGDVVANLETLKPIYADFEVPERYFNQVKNGQTVILQVGSELDHAFRGVVTAKSAAVDTDSRNFTVRARLDNKKELLKPGMFAHVDLRVGQAQRVTVIPRTGVVYSLYGDHVFTLTAAGKDKQGQLYKVKQVPVVLGEVIGSNVIIKSGVKVGTPVVVSGQLKIFNGSTVRVNNSVKLKPVGSKELEGA